MPNTSITLKIKDSDEGLLFAAFLKKYPMPSGFTKTEDWIKEKVVRDWKMIIREYLEEQAMTAASQQANVIYANAKDSVVVPDIIE